MKKYKDLKLLYYSQAEVLSKTAKQLKQEVQDEYGESVLNTMTSEGRQFEDEYEVRRYGLYLANDGNQLVLCVTACSKEDYDKDEKNLPEIDEVAEDLSEECEDVDNYFPICVFDKAIVFGYKWHDSETEYMVVENKDIYDDLVNENYHRIIAYIEEYF